MARIRFAAALLLLVAGCTSDGPLAPQDDAAYPTTIPALSPEAQSALEAEFAQTNPRICSSVNEYGFTHGLCSTGSKGLDSDANVESLITLARNTIVRNSRFTGVANPSELVVAVARKLNYPHMLRLDFESQTRAGLAVEGTVISVLMDGEGVLSISGHHYPEIRFPSHTVPAGKAETSILGLKIHYSDWTGGKDYVVDRDSFRGDPMRVIYPRETDAAVELHVAWQIHVGFFYVYVDTATLEVLGTRMLVWF